MSLLDVPWFVICFVKFPYLTVLVVVLSLEEFSYCYARPLQLVTISRYKNTGHIIWGANCIHCSLQSFTRVTASWDFNAKHNTLKPKNERIFTSEWWVSSGTLAPCPISSHKKRDKGLCPLWKARLICQIQLQSIVIQLCGLKTVCTEVVICCRYQTREWFCFSNHKNRIQGYYGSAISFHLQSQ